MDIKPANYQYTRVCSYHFISGKPSQLYDKTNPDWVPSLNGETSCRDQDRYVRAKDRVAKRARFEEIEAETKRKLLKKVRHDEDNSGIAVQTDITEQNFIQLEQNLSALQQESNHVNREVKALRQRDNLVNVCDSVVPID